VQGLFINRHFTPAALPAHMLHVPFLPFSEIFPYCAAIVHHGGVGTTAEALAAGSPQLILPLGFDQLDNGVRVKKLGVGLHTRSKHGFVAHRGPIASRHIREISEALRRILSPEFRERCATISQRLQNNKSLEQAAELIETLALCDSPRRS
jgi:rhamnosyltransferase subunit B